MSENIHFEIQSVADIQTGEALSHLGRVLDDFPDLAPDRMGPKDPPRTPVDRIEPPLRAWAAVIRPGDYFNQFLARTQPPHTYGLLWVTGDIWNFPPIAPHRLELGVDAAWLEGAERTKRFAELFRGCCEAMDACYGYAGLTSLNRQANDFNFAARMAGTLEWPGMPGTGWDVREHAVPNIYWLNYFGPAFRAHWGEDRLDGVGIRQEPTANGGVVVWATATPFTFDAAATGLSSYGWKRPFLDALGVDTFIHEHWRDPGKGVVVPTFEEHGRYTTSSPGVRSVGS